MRVLTTVAGLFVLAVIFLDAFQTIILSRRPAGRVRITRMFYLATWHPFRALVTRLPSRAQREQLYSFYGPFSLIVLFFLWALLLSTGYALIFFGLKVAFHDPLLTSKSEWARLRSCLYVSGTTLFTLGLGDVLPTTHLARLWMVIEAGTGLGFVALVIGYLPVLYTAFSAREVAVALLDARAGSPPTATEMLQRHSFDGGPEALRDLLSEWERWCAEMLETHISYPILCYYRSQHDNQNWLTALTAILDTCALMIAMMDGEQTRQAQLTFAIGRHALADLVQVFRQEQAERTLRNSKLTRLPDAQLARLCEALEGTGFSPCADFESERRLYALRMLYEPYACTLAEYLRLGLPEWIAPEEARHRNDVWTVVRGLARPDLLADRLTTHVSEQATAAHLENHDESYD